MVSWGGSGSQQISVDVLIVTAVKDERDGILKCEADWKLAPDLDPSGFPFHIRRDSGGITWALARAIDMGGDYAANVATRLVSHLKPRCLAMVGVCAGWRKKVQLGDVIVADRLFRYDAGKLVAYRKGSIGKEKVFHDIRTYNLDPRWRQRAEDFPSDWVQTILTAHRPLGFPLQEAWLLTELIAFETGSCPHPRDQLSRRDRCPDWADVVTRLEKRGMLSIHGEMNLTVEGRRFAEAMRNRWPDGIPKERLCPKAHVAPIATGSRVIEDADLFPTIHTYVRKTLGVDMEGAAIGAVAEIENIDHCIVVKGVQDHADPDKDDRYRAYAIECSYRFLTAFLRSCLPPPKRRMPFIVPQQPIDNFIGRDTEVRALERIFLHDRNERACTVAVLCGAPGAGKSSLAVDFASVHRDAFDHGVFGLRVDGKELGAIAHEFARTAGKFVDADDERDPGALMQEVFRNREALLIFDNAESPDIRTLIPGGQCAVIVTTRDRGFSVALGLPTAARIEVPVLPREDAVELLRRRLGKRVDADPKAAERIATVVGCLPLALQIVAAALELDPWLVLGDFAEILEAERDRLSRLRVRGDRTLDLRVSFTASLRFLKPDEIDFFACLGVCAGNSFAIHAAAAASGSAEVIARDRLVYLYRLSLVNALESSSSPRFFLHPLVRDFARELAQERQLLETARERHARHFVELVTLGDDRISKNSDLAADTEEVIASANWLLDRADINGPFLISLWPLLQQAGAWQEGADLTARFLEIAETHANANTTTHLRIQQAKFLQLLGSFDAAYDVLQPEPSCLSEKLPPPSRLDAMLFNSLGGVLQRLGRFDEAATALQRSHELLVEQGDERGVAMVLNSLGGVLQRLGRLQDADRAFCNSISLGRKLCDRLHLAKAHTAFGKSLFSRGALPQAIQHLREGFYRDEHAGNVRGLRIVTQPLVDALRQSGANSDADEILRRALTVAPDDPSLKRLSKLESYEDVVPFSPESAQVVRGRIKRLLEPLGRPRYGFLTRDDDGTDVYFNERRIGPELFSVLSPRVAVEAAIIVTLRGPQALRIRIVPDE